MVKENGKLIRWKEFNPGGHDWWLFLEGLDIGIRVLKLHNGYYRIEAGGDSEELECSLKSAKAHAEADLKRRLDVVEVTSG